MTGWKPIPLLTFQCVSNSILYSRVIAMEFTMILPWATFGLGNSGCLGADQCVFKRRQPGDRAVGINLYRWDAIRKKSGQGMSKLFEKAAPARPRPSAPIGTGTKRTAGPPGECRLQPGNRPADVSGDQGGHAGRRCSGRWRIRDEDVQPVTATAYCSCSIVVGHASVCGSISRRSRPARNRWRGARRRRNAGARPRCARTGYRRRRPT